MEHLKDIQLSEKHQKFIASMINVHGTGEHPICDSQTYPHFTTEYVKELIDSERVATALNPTGLEILVELKQIFAEV